MNRKKRCINYCCIALLILSAGGARGQKTPLGPLSQLQMPDTRADAKITDNGRYILFRDRRNAEDAGTFQLQSADGQWKYDLTKLNPREVSFLSGSAHAAALLPGDSLAVLELGTGRAAYLSGISACKVSPAKGSHQAALLLAGPERKLVLRDLKSGRQRQVANNVNEFRYADDGSKLIITTALDPKDSTVALQLANAGNGQLRQVWKGRKYEQLLVSPDGAQLAFLAEQAERVYAIWYYRDGWDAARETVSSALGNIPPQMSVDNQPLSFGIKGRQLFYTLRKKEAEQKKENTNPDLPSFDLWSYQDLVAPDEGHRLHPSTEMKAVVQTEDRSTIMLTGEYSSIAYNPGGSDKGFILVKYQPGLEYERYWNDSAREGCKLVSTIDGSVVEDFKANAFFQPIELSPNARYVIYFDYKVNHWFSYHIASGVTANITRDIPVSLVDEENAMTAQPPYAYGSAGWYGDDEWVLMYDRYDIWKVDPAGKKPSLNLTNGYGRKHDISLRIVHDSWKLKALKEGEERLITARNTKTKDNGFWKSRLDRPADPAPYVEMQPYIMYCPGSFIGEPPPPLKARDASVYLTTRQSASFAPNLFLIGEKGNMRQLTDLQPQAAHNWMTAELITWTTLDNKTSQGILYKPENFDPSRKYPVIFYFYMDHLSEGLHQFVKPEPSVMLNVPYYVSNGYLVCVADIQYTIGKPGPSTYNSIVAAADHLAKRPYVDAAHMGLAGHSFGSYEVNYLVANTPRFAAAYSGCGYSNIVSLYGEGSVQMMWCEISQTSIGASLSERPDLYVENSPVFKANKVVTPLLMVNNRGDKVNFTQGIQFFNALRRLRRKAWLLQYDGEGHVFGGKALDDFSVRQAQFFDHFLKGKPAPIWMTKGIPPSMKGTEDGLAFE